MLGNKYMCTFWTFYQKREEKKTGKSENYPWDWGWNRKDGATFSFP